MTTYKLGLKSETTGEIVATLRDSETTDRQTAAENATRHNDDLDHLPDYCHYVVVKVSDKPAGTFRCLACGRTWDGSQLYQDPSTTWTCGNLTCGGTVEPVPGIDKKGDANV